MGTSDVPSWVIQGYHHAGRAIMQEEKRKGRFPHALNHLNAFMLVLTMSLAPEHNERLERRSLWQVTAATGR